MVHVQTIYRTIFVIFEREMAKMLIVICDQLKLLELGPVRVDVDYHSIKGQLQNTCSLNLLPVGPVNFHYVQFLCSKGHFLGILVI